MKETEDWGALSEPGAGSQRRGSRVSLARKRQRTGEHSVSLAWADRGGEH